MYFNPVEARLVKLKSIFYTLAVLVPSVAVTADLVIYPAQGQSAEQQQSDEGECFSWAKNKTGIDPLAAAAAPPPPAQQSSGGATGGAVRGAMIGGIIDGSDGAKTGAAIGAVSSRMRRNKINRAAAQQNQKNQQQAQATNAENKATFNKAYGVCLQGKGYTIG